MLTCTSLSSLCVAPSSHLTSSLVLLLTTLTCSRKRCVCCCFVVLQFYLCCHCHHFWGFPFCLKLTLTSVILLFVCLSVWLSYISWNILISFFLMFSFAVLFLHFTCTNNFICFVCVCARTCFLPLFLSESFSFIVWAILILVFLIVSILYALKTTWRRQRNT